MGEAVKNENDKIGTAGKYKYALKNVTVTLEDWNFTLSGKTKGAKNLMINGKKYRLDTVNWKHGKNYENGALTDITSIML